MAKVRELCYVFDVYLYNNLPSLYHLLKTHDVTPMLYASTWFITLFTEHLPRRTINKLWHLFVIEGWKVFIQFGVAVLCVF